MLTLEFLADLAARHGDALAVPPVARPPIAGQDWPVGPALMGVINLSPESWYRESVCLTQETALRRGKVLHSQGAWIVDVGAESSLAHAAKVAGSLQTSLLLPVIRGLVAQGMLVSAETYHLEVARAAFEAGAKVLNLTGNQDAEEFFRLAVEHDATVILCYVEGGSNVRQVGDFDLTGDVVGRMLQHFDCQIKVAQRCGLNRLILDPGLGFYYRNLQDSSQRIRHQMQTFLETFRLKSLGFPVCHALPHAFEYFGEEVRSAEAFFAVLAALGKTDLFRTHEIPRVKAVLQTVAAF